MPVIPCSGCDTFKGLGLHHIESNGVKQQAFAICHLGDFCKNICIFLRVSAPSDDKGYIDCLQDLLDGLCCLCRRGIVHQRVCAHKVNSNNIGSEFFHVHPCPLGRIPHDILYILFENFWQVDRHVKDIKSDCRRVNQRM